MLPSADIIFALQWYAVMLAVGIPGWLLISRRTKELPDGGYGLGKAVGLIGLATVTWVLCIARLLPFTQPALWILTAFMWGAVIYRRAELLPLLKKHWKTIIITELFCIALFIIGVMLRASKPQIEGIEKFMDSGILNSILRTEKGPPLDQWYGGKVINYYYFGHWIVGLIAKMAGTPGWIAFNLGFATVVSVAGSQLITAGWTLTRRVRGGMLVVFLALFASNMHPFIAWLKHDKSYFFFNSGRFVDFRINEYPFYSLSLGDLHAHMLSLMLTTTLAVFAILHLLIDKSKLKSNALYMGILLGLMAATNAFDTLTCSVLVGLVLLLRWYRAGDRTFKSLWMPSLYCAAAAAVPIGVFLTHFVQPTGGIGVKLFEIPFMHIVWQFGIPLGLLAASLVVLYALKSFGPSRKMYDLLQKGDERHLLVAVFAIFAVVLIILPEFVFIKDLYFYVNPNYSLANTEFKVWYTGWMALAVATGSGVVLVLNALWKKHKPYALLGVVIVALSITVLSVGIKRGLETLKDKKPPHLNGITYMNSTEPDRVRAVEWAAETIQGQPLFVEAVGDSYSNYSWFSSYTGLPSIMGWRSHEFGWRYSKDAWTLIVGRENAVKQIYNAATASELRTHVTTEKVSYVLVGPQERGLYAVRDTVFAEAFGSPVFNSPTIKIYYTGVR